MKVGSAGFCRVPPVAEAGRWNQLRSNSAHGVTLLGAFGDLDVKEDCVTFLANGERVFGRSEHGSRCTPEKRCGPENVGRGSKLRLRKNKRKVLFVCFSYNETNN